MGYQYRGKIHDASAPQEESASNRRAPFDSDKCGTYAGYKQHRRFEQEPCAPCKAGAAAYKREWDANRRGRVIVKGFNPAKCGTRAGYAAHIYHKVPFCAPCRAANSKHSAELREQTKTTERRAA